MYRACIFLCKQPIQVINVGLEQDGYIPTGSLIITRTLLPLGFESSPAEHSKWPCACCLVGLTFGQKPPLALCLFIV